MIKVCDFGLSRLIISSGRKVATFGTAGYAAPELTTQNHDKEVDVFSFGIVLWEIDNGVRAWRQYEFDRDKWMAIERGERPPLNTNSPLGSLIAECWSALPRDRPTFARIHSTLLALKHSVEAFDQNPMPIVGASNTSELLPARSEMEGNLLSAFSMQITIRYPQFVNLFKAKFNIKSDLEDFYYAVCVSPEEDVSKDRVQLFLQWFSPFCDSPFRTGMDEGISTTLIDALLQWVKTLDPDLQSRGYLIKQILKIVSQKWFHGFITSDQARELLVKFPKGSFLVRFSSQPGCFTLSAVVSTYIYHWRILSLKKGLIREPIFVIEGREFESLQQLINTFHEEPLVIGDASEKEFIVLRNFVAREDPPHFRDGL